MSRLSLAETDSREEAQATGKAASREGPAPALSFLARPALNLSPQRRLLARADEGNDQLEMIQRSPGLGDPEAPRRRPGIGCP
jgi:hypothetical protein